MRALWNGLGVALICLAGCWTTETNLKPPPPPPEYVLPPTDDARFSTPPAFPEKTLNQGPRKPEAPGFPGGPGGMRGPGGAGGPRLGPGMGGY